MRKARLWALFGLGGMAMLPPLLALVDFNQVTAVWLFAVWVTLIVGTAIAVRRS